jgi:hypothetical protein
MKYFLYFLGVVIAIGAGFMVYRYLMVKQNNPGQAYCAPDLQLCLNGTSVGRVGPECNFAACPNYVSETVADQKQGITYNYPKLETKYISTVKWPPGVSVATGTFSCFVGGSEIQLQGVTEKREINGRNYCIKKESEGAAGSIYTSFTYWTSTDTDRVLLASSTLRFVQCANYDEPNRSACERERSVFSMDQIMDLVLESVHSLSTTTPL